MESPDTHFVTPKAASRQKRERQWARDVLDISQESSSSSNARDAMRQAVLTRIEQDGVHLSDREFHAVSVLVHGATENTESPGLPVPKPSRLSAFEEDYEAKLSAELNDFANRFFSLTLVERKQEFDRLLEETQRHLPLHRRVQQLEMGLTVDVDSLELVDEQSSQLARYVQEIFTAAPTERGLRRRQHWQFVKNHINSKDFADAAEALQEQFSEFANLAPKFLEEIATHESRQRELERNKKGYQKRLSKIPNFAGTTIPQSPETDVDHWALALACGMVLIVIVFVASSSSKKPDRREQTYYFHPEYGAISEEKFDEIYERAVRGHQERARAENVEPFGLVQSVRFATAWKLVEEGEKQTFPAREDFSDPVAGNFALQQSETAQQNFAKAFAVLEELLTELPNREECPSCLAYLARAAAGHVMNLSGDEELRVCQVGLEAATLAMELDSRRSATMHSVQGVLLNRLGNRLRQDGQHTKAIETLHAAIRKQQNAIRLEPTDNHDWQHRLDGHLHDMNRALLDAGYLEAAQALALERRQRRPRDLKNLVDVAKIFGGIAQAYESQGDTAAAEATKRLAMETLLRAREAGLKFLGPLRRQPGLEFLNDDEPWMEILLNAIADINNGAKEGAMNAAANIFRVGGET